MCVPHLVYRGRAALAPGERGASSAASDSCGVCYQSLPPGHRQRQFMHCCPHLVCAACTSAWLAQRVADERSGIRLPCPMGCQGDMSPAVVAARKLGLPVLRCPAWPRLSLASVRYELASRQLRPLTLPAFLRRRKQHRHCESPGRPSRAWTRMA